MHPLRGVWTYRSFYNVESGQLPANKIKVWEAELYLDVDPQTNRVFGHLGERPDKTPEFDTAGKPYPYLFVEGSYTEGKLTTLTFRAVGRRGSAWEDWIYDYQCVLAPAWTRQPDFPADQIQRPTLVGTTLRTVAHDGAPAGESFSFYAVKHNFKEPRIAAPLPEAVVTMLASEEMRLHHQLWHASRDMWDDLRDEQKKWLRDNKWQPGPVGAERSAGLAPNQLSNHSGEDFLFMHRRMIKSVRDIAGPSSMPAWQRLPQPWVPLSDFSRDSLKISVGNMDGNAVPPAFVIPDDAATTAWLAHLRSDAAYTGRFRVWEAQYTNPSWLASVTLGELGAWIEFTIHNWMHMRWTSVQRDPDTGLPVEEGRQPDDFAAKWLKPENDHLGATFSSHVHPVFWRLHGWVDDRIEDWFKAQQAVRPGVVTRRVLKDVEWFDADGTWVNVTDPWEGPVSAEGGGHHHHAGLDVEVMKKAIVVIIRGVDATVADSTTMSARTRELPAPLIRFQNWS